MERTVLVSGSDAAFGDALVERARDLSLSVLQARVFKDGESIDEAIDELEESINPSLRWNPRSPISARSLFLEATDQLGHIDESIVVFGPLGESEGLHEMSPVTI